MQTSIILTDISQYDDIAETPQTVDFEKMKEKGAQGTIIKVGEGDWIDKNALKFYTNSKGVILRGLYWFLDSRYEPIAQVKKFVDFINSNGVPELECWFDWEDGYKGSWSSWKHLSVAIAEFERLLPNVKIGVYTGFYYFKDNGPNTTTELASNLWFKKYPLWLAFYSKPEDVQIPKPWDTILLWQFNDRGDGLGYGTESKGLDLSYFQGTQEEFDARYNVSVTPTPDPVPTPTPAPVPVPEPTPTPDPVPAPVILSPIGTAIVLMASLNVRFGPSTTYAVNNSVVKGKTFNVYKITKDTAGNQWLQVDNTHDLWACQIFNGVNFCSYSPTTTPSPVEPPTPLPESPPVVVVPPVPNDGKTWWYIKDDLWFDANAPYVRVGLPATKLLMGGTGSINIPEQWMNYINSMNPTQQAYLWKDASGWHNQGSSNNVREITFAGNVVKGYMDNGKLMIKHYTTDQTPPNFYPPLMGFDNPDGLTHYFTAGYRDHLDMSTSNRWPRIIVLGNTREHLWMRPIDVVPYTIINKDVTVTIPLLNVRSNPNAKTQFQTTKKAGDIVKIYATVPVGADIWGRVGINSWMVLYLGGQYTTDYRP